jgi:hypothetical protein
MHKFLKKMTRLERAALRKQKLEEVLAGTGKYIFKNNTSGDLELPKKNLDGKNKVAKNEEFMGDSYFLQLVKTNDLKLVRILGETMDNKLITEQPPVVTHEGKVEFTINEKPINEEKDPKKKDVLLTEDPMGGIVIVD